MTQQLVPQAERREQSMPQLKMRERIWYAFNGDVNAESATAAMKARSDKAPNYFPINPLYEKMQQIGGITPKPEPVVEAVLPPRPNILESEPVLSQEYIDGLMAEKDMGLDAVATTSDISGSANDDAVVPAEDDNEARIRNLTVTAKASAKPMAESNMLIQQMAA